MNLLKKALTVVLLGSVALASGMTRRDDRTDQQYRDHGDLFGAVGMVGVNGGWNGSGTLIASNWVLTAAHVVDRGSSNPTFTVGGITYNATEYHVNPGWTGDLGAGRDLTLLKLSTNVVGITPIGLYQGATGTEVGKMASVVGYGGTGTGTAGWNNNYDLVRRGGTNMVDGINWTVNGFTASNTLVMDFDNPGGTKNTLASLGSTATPTDLEMNVIFGDSGGGLFIQESGQWRLAGVTSWLWTLGGGNFGGYGDASGFTAVSGQMGWINSVVPEPTTFVLLGAGLAAMLRRRKR